MAPRVPTLPGLLCGLLVVNVAAKSKYTCDRPLDVVFCLDASGSVNNVQWQASLAFVRDVSSAFDFGPTQMAVAQFSDTSTLNITLNQYTNASQFGAAVMAVQQRAGGTNTWLGVDTSAAETALRGRKPEEGAAHMIIVITDGQSNNAALTAAAADGAWEAGNTMVLITIGVSVSPVERQAFTRGNADLDFPLEDWDGIDEDGALVSNLTSLVCSAPIAPDNLNPINTTIPCNSSLLALYYPNVTAPLNLLANVSQGGVTVCYSYTVTQPSPDDARVNSAVQCSYLRAGSANIATVTAYPFGNATGPSSSSSAGGGGGGQEWTTLYVSISSSGSGGSGGSGGGGTGSDCGGSVVLQPYYCSTRLALNVTRITGDGQGATVCDVPSSWLQAQGWSWRDGVGVTSSSTAAAAAWGAGYFATTTAATAAGASAGCDIYTTWVGDRDMPRCSECPDGTARLSTDPSSPLYEICGQGCAGRDQFILADASSDGVETCRDCHSTCSACEAPGAVRNCMACPNPAPGGLLYNTADPALTSPFWQQYGGVPVALSASDGEGVEGSGSTADGQPASMPPVVITATTGAAASPVSGSAASGRCLSSCPAGYTFRDSGSGYNETVCSGSPTDLAGNSPIILATVCLPRAAYPDLPSGSDCRSLQGGQTVANIAASLAVAWAVPLPAVFLSSCMDLPLTAAPSNGTRQSPSGIPSGAQDRAERWSWGYSDPSPSAVQAATLLNPYYTLAAATAGGVNAVPGGTASTAAPCNCSVVLGFSLVLAVAAPGEATTPAARAAGVSSITTEPAAIAARSTAALALLRTAFVNSASSSADQLSTPTLGAVTAGTPLDGSCAACMGRTTPRPVVLSACALSTAATYILPPTVQEEMQAITLCGPAVIPPPPASDDNGAAGGLAAFDPVGGGIGLFLGCLAALVLGVWYARFRQRRLELVQDAKRKMRLRARMVAAAAAHRSKIAGLAAAMSGTEPPAAATVELEPGRLPVSSLGAAVRSLGDNPMASNPFALNSEAARRTGGSGKERAEFGPTGASFKGLKQGSLRGTVETVAITATAAGSGAEGDGQTSVPVVVITGQLPQPEAVPLPSPIDTAAEPVPAPAPPPAVPVPDDAAVVLNPLAALSPAREAALSAAREAALLLQDDDQAGATAGGAEGGAAGESADALEPLPELPSLAPDAIPAARPSIHAMAGQVLEFLVPGSVSLGLALTSDAVVALPQETAVAETGAGAGGPGQGKPGYTRQQRVALQAGQASSSRELALPDAVKVLKQVERVETVQLRPVSWVRGREARDIEAVRHALAAAEAGGTGQAAVAGAAAAASFAGSTGAAAAPKPAFVRQFSVVKRETVVAVQDRGRGKGGTVAAGGGSGVGWGSAAAGSSTASGASGRMWTAPGPAGPAAGR